LSKAWAGYTLGALDILDRFHSIRKFNEVIDEIRRGEVKQFKAKRQLSSGAVVGMNLKAKLTMRKAYRFRTLRCLQIALYHELGKLLEPEYLHRFC